MEGFARWNGTSWDSIAPVRGRIYSFAEMHNKLYLSGEFSTSKNTGGNLSEFDGVSLNTSIGLFNAAVLRVRNINDTLYACGNFRAFPPNSSNYICFLDNGAWVPFLVPAGTGQAVTDIQEYHHKKYLTHWGNSTLDVVSYNGSGFDSVFQIYGRTDLFCQFKDKLFIGGQFFETINNMNYYSVVSYSDVNNNILSPYKLISPVSIYPNPSIDRKVLLCAPEKFKTDVEIYNSIGIKIKQFQFAANEAVTLNSGCYIFKIVYEGNVYSQKVIIE